MKKAGSRVIVMRKLMNTRVAENMPKDATGINFENPVAKNATIAESVVDIRTNTVFLYT
jgi:hypothetical protein